MNRYINSSQDRFQNYRTITAKFASIGKCGHPIAKGDTIGYHRIHGCQCPACWQRWTAENQEADMLEQQSGYQSDYSSEQGNW